METKMMRNRRREDWSAKLLVACIRELIVLHGTFGCGRPNTEMARIAALRNIQILARRLGLFYLNDDLKLLRQLSDCLQAMASSRIFIRGLPPSLGDDDFRKHFSQRYTVTDAKLFPQRRIGYVGYRDSDEAAKAVKYFNKTFINMSKIAVELARPVSISQHTTTAPY